MRIIVGNNFKKDLQYDCLATAILIVTYKLFSDHYAFSFLPSAHGCPKFWFSGITPDGIVGHSVGELGCAYADGSFTAKEVILAAYWRGEVL